MNIDLLHWEDSLDEYLLSSNEDERIVEFFRTSVVETTTRMLKTDSIRWLDVGSGPGTKTCLFSAHLAASVSPQRIELTMLDPQFKNDRNLAARVFMDSKCHVGQLAIEPVTLEQFVNRQTGVFDLVTAIHFLYSSSLIIPFMELIESASPAVLFLVCESSSSDFYRMRATLLNEGVNAPQTVLEDVARLLQTKGFSVRRFTIDGQTCRIDRDYLMDKDDHWLFRFLVARNKKDFLSDTALRATVCRVVRQYVARLPLAELSVPDSAVIAVSPLS